MMVNSPRIGLPNTTSFESGTLKVKELIKAARAVGGALGDGDT